MPDLRARQAADASLRAELLARFAEDQAALRVFLAEADRHRERFGQTQRPPSGTPWPYALLEWDPPREAPAIVQRVIAAVRGNTVRLREIVAAGGWPGRSRVGEVGADAAWLLLQHTNSRVTTIRSADGDEFCRSCVGLLRDAVARGEAHPRHLAAIADSLRLANHEPPEYASLPEQYAVDGDGRAVFPGDVDPAALDQRRAGIGLPPLAAEIARRRAAGQESGIGPDRWEPWPGR